MTLNYFSFISVFTVYDVYDRIWMLWTIDQLGSALSPFLSRPSLSLSSVTLSRLSLSLVSPLRVNATPRPLPTLYKPPLTVLSQ